MLRVFEGFSGIGAWNKALTRLQIEHEIVGYAENDPYPAKAYSIIHNELESKNIGDIIKFNGKFDNLDLFCYSPPCQSFSAAGKQLGFDDKRGVLFFDALRLIKNSIPKYCIMENVKGLTQKKFENEFTEMLKNLKETGYNNYYKVLNAKDYGICQNRERLFIISIRQDIDDYTFEFPNPIPLKKRLEDIIESDAELPILHNIYGGFNEKEPRVFNEYSPTIRTSAGGGHIPSVVIKGCSLRTRNYKGQPQQLEIRKDDNSNTIISVSKDSMLAIIDDTYKGRDERIYSDYSPSIRSQRSGLKVIDGKTIRTLTNLECGRLMDFDDEDILKLIEAGLSKTRIYKMLGNSICVCVIEEILKKLFKL